jgi:hypothetical protein
MTNARALELLSAPFVELRAYEAARDHALSIATPNQRALYAKLPAFHQGSYLRTLVRQAA